MPFKSISQLNTCYARSKNGWNCDHFLKNTPSVCCLPYKSGSVSKSRCMRSGERIVGNIQIGPRGGKFFTIKENDKSGIVCVVKVYINRK